MDDNIERALASLPAEELQFLNETTTNGIINWWLDYEDEEDALDIFPAVWPLLEKRLLAHPNEARETGAFERLPIHHAFRDWGGVWQVQTAAPLSLVQLLIETYPEGLHFQDDHNEQLPLHSAAGHPCIECFRAVLYNCTVEAIITKDRNGNTPLYLCAWQTISLAPVWEMICYNRQCVDIQNDDDQTALQRLEHHFQQSEGQHVTRQNAKVVILKMAANYNHVPPVPSDEMIAVIESHPVCTAIAPRLEPGKDAFVIHQALAAKCPSVLVEALIQIFPNQVQQEFTVGRLPLHIALQHGLGASVRALVDSYPAAMFTADPVSGRLPIGQAMLNVGNDESLGNVGAVNALLRANPAFLE